MTGCREVVWHFSQKGKVSHPYLHAFLTETIENVLNYEESTFFLGGWDDNS